ncbi:MAG: hypothetical protein VCC02_00880 [Myxococcota bacterium]
MTDLAILVSFLIVAGSAAALVAPLRLLDWVSHSFGWGLLALGSALRIGMGLVLFFAGMTAYWPDFVQTAGFLIVLAGLALPFVGLERVRRIIAWEAELGPGVVRVGALFGVALGGALLVGLGVFGA